MAANPLPTAGGQIASADTTMAGQTIDVTKLTSLGGTLRSRFEMYERDRRIQELKWMRNLRQWLGEYDPEVASSLGVMRSKAYPKLTRVKVISMVARLMNMLFPVSEKNWAVKASPIPNLPPEVLAEAADQVLAAIQGGSESPDADDQLTTAIRQIAEKRAAKLELVITDQLAELGGSKDVDYVTLCRDVLMSGVLYGVGVLKGPFVRGSKISSWQRDPMTPGRIIVREDDQLKPQFEPVNIWDYYPDMSARRWSEMDGQFERHIMSRHQLQQLTKRNDFFGEEITKYLKENTTGNYKMRPHETELRNAGVAVHVNHNDGRKYEAIEWTGYESAHTMREAGFDVPEELMSGEVEINVWLLDDRVIKADISPWTELGEERINTYHQFIYEKDDTSITGNGLPNVIRDSQMGICAAVRMALDNAGVTAGPQLEVNTSLLRADQDLGNIVPYKIWYRDDDGPSQQYPAVREIKIDSHIADLKIVADMFMNFADQESFINPATGGDLQKMPSEPFRNAAGASMIRGDLALPFKDAIRNFDQFTLSVINSMIVFNKHFNTDPSIKGDYSPVARASSSLVAKEVRGMQLDQFMQMLTPQEQAYIKGYKMLIERAKVRDLPIDEVIVTESEADLIDKQQQEAAAAENQKQEELIAATIRKLLSEALKNLTQGDKNAAVADAETATTTMEILERGLGIENGGQGGGGSPDGKPSGSGGDQPRLGAPTTAGNQGGPAPE